MIRGREGGIVLIGFSKSAFCRTVSVYTGSDSGPFVFKNEHFKSDIW